MPQLVSQSAKSKLKKLKAYRTEAFELCAYIQQFAPKTYVVGGVVRDMLLDRTKATADQSLGDIDLATEARPEKIKKILENCGIAFYKVGEKFGTIAALIQDRPVEITTFRTEKKYSDARHPDRVMFVRDPKLDALRRDFTVNAIFYDPTTKKFLDFVDGQKDLRAKKIRFVGSAQKRIKEDPLRMLRAIRFAALLDFTIVPADLAQIKKNAGLVKKVSGQRIKQELDKIILSDGARQALSLLDKSRLLENFLPEVARLKETKQSPNYHAEGNVFVHSLMVLDQVKDRGLDLKYAALFHDLGKYFTAKKTIKNGRLSILFHNHSAKGAEIFKKIAKRLPFSRKDRQTILYLILHHLDLHTSDRLTEKVLRRWARNYDFEKLIQLCVADRQGSIKTDSKSRLIKRDFSAWAKLLNRLKKINKKPLPRLLNGDEVMRLLKIKPGLKVGEILAEISDLQAAGKIRSKAQAIAFLNSILKHRG